MAFRRDAWTALGSEEGRERRVTKRGKVGWKATSVRCWIVHWAREKGRGEEGDGAPYVFLITSGTKYASCAWWNAATGNSNSFDSYIVPNTSISHPSHSHSHPPNKPPSIFQV